ncbi:MAG: ZipA [Azoarcus sp.]|jgi:FtsZ-interacting cell division protein ZipA|nr:ZipA [Azoarcus sp.]
MDTLQIALIGIIVAVVTGIVAFNKWQERRHRHRAARAFPSSQRDPLLEKGGDGEIPSMPGEPENKRQELDGQGKTGADEPTAASPESKHNQQAYYQPPRQRVRPPLPDSLDPRVDCCIRIEAVEPIEVPRFWAAQAEVFDNISRTLRWYAFDDRENQWRRINASAVGAHHWFLAALQLVDRGGMVSEGDFLRYTRGIQRLADQFRSVPAGIPSRAEILGNAKALDNFCAEVDVQIVINLVAMQPMMGSHIFSLAEAGGLRLEGDGSFHARAADSRTLYILSNGDAALFERSTMAGLRTRRLSLVLDLPRVVDAASEFEEMMRFAVLLAKKLGADVVDDNGRPFGTESVDAIRTRVRHYQARMSEEGISPGSSLARRLFNA